MRRKKSKGKLVEENKKKQTSQKKKKGTDYIKSSYRSGKKKRLVAGGVLHVKRDTATCHLQ